MLFVVVIAQRDMDYQDRTVAGYFFYTPSKEDLEQIKRDYDELYELVKTGQVETINARIGHIIQMRPKGADGKACKDLYDKDNTNYIMDKCFSA